MIRILPRPQHIEEREGRLLLDYHCRITMDSSCPSEVFFYASQLAEQLKKSDYDKYDYLIAMEERNRKNMLRILGKDAKNKVSLLLDYADEHGDIADPWYTGNFDATYEDVEKGCRGFLEFLNERS